MSPTRNDFKKIQNTETKLKSKCFQIQWVYSFLFFYLTPLNCFEVTGKISNNNMFILLTYVTYSEWQYKNIKIQNTETKLKSKCFEIQWVYSFCVFFFNPSEWLWSYRRNSYHEYVIIVDLFHLLGITIQKLQIIQKPNWNQNVFKSNGFTVLLFFSLTPLNGYEVTGEIATTNMLLLLSFIANTE